VALYIVTNVGRDKTGEIAQVRWINADKQRNRFKFEYAIVSVDEVIAAIDRGDFVEIRFDGPYGPRYGGRVCRRLLANGVATIAEANPVPGRSLRDQPRI
jgi:hypothetical protein